MATAALRQPDLESVIDRCAELMGGTGPDPVAVTAARVLEDCAQLDSAGRRAVYTHLVRDYDVDVSAVREAYRRWEAVVDSGSQGATELTGLFDVVEPARQQLLRRLNHAPGGTLALTELRADVRWMLPEHPDLQPLDHDLLHLLTSWFNRGFLSVAEVTWESSSPEVRQHLRQYERVHPMATPDELRRRIEPSDRRVFACFHPATGDVPLIFVEVALCRGVPDRIATLLGPGPALPSEEADCAVLYSINNSLAGLAGISFGSMLIKQVIARVREELPQITDVVTLSPIPGFRSWLDGHADEEAGLRSLRTALDRWSHTPDGGVEVEAVSPAMVAALRRYLTEEKRPDGQPLDPVARFHLGNAATVEQLNWPANVSDEAWRQSFGAMVNYRYDARASVDTSRHEKDSLR
ncbi:malonyl-CoA decarboxylase domain-containing protein [Janibacter sp. GS2]|uniref:malonyl-CoA decarboxylase domain-containing protein n=1 Tax=Janibacter sp. GS2 TaxID=3442646 RepID=UPI003EBAC8F0